LFSQANILLPFFLMAPDLVLPAKQLLLLIKEAALPRPARKMHSNNRIADRRLGEGDLVALRSLVVRCGVVNVTGSQQYAGKSP
jgi:hypothetical protein